MYESLYLTDLQLFHLLHLEIERDWGPSPLLVVFSGHEINLSTDLRFLHSPHSFDSEEKELEQTLNSIW